MTTIEIYKQRNRSATAKEGNPPGSGHNRHKLRWRAKAANGRKVANGGAAYINFGDVVTELEALWPELGAAHVQVTFAGKTVPLAQVRSLAP